MSLPQREPVVPSGMQIAALPFPTMGKAASSLGQVIVLSLHLRMEPGKLFHELVAGIS